MEETLIKFETAKLAKEKGFDEECDYVYADEYNRFKDVITPNIKVRFRGAAIASQSDVDGVWLQKTSETNQGIDRQKKHEDLNRYRDVCTAPTQSLLQKWLREEHNIEAQVNAGWKDGRIYEYYVWDGYKDDISSYPRYYETYEEALEKALQEALKLI